MIRLSITLLSLCHIFLATAQGNWQVEQEEVIRKRIDEFVTHINTANAEGFVDAFSNKLYAEATKEGIKASVLEREKYYGINYSIHIKEVKVDNKMAYEEGWFRSELVPKNGDEKVIQVFDFLDVWELEDDGQWRIVKAMKKERPLDQYKKLSELNGEYAQIAGTYSTDKFPIDIKVTASDQIVLIVNNGSPIALKKTEKFTYNLDGVSGAELHFEMGEDGMATKAIMKQTSGNVIAYRQ